MNVGAVNIELPCHGPSLHHGPWPPALPYHAMAFAIAYHGRPWPCLAIHAGRPKRGSRAINFSFFVLACFHFFNLRKNFSFFVLACFHFFNFEAHELLLFHFLLSRAFTFSTSEKNFRFWRSRAFNFSLSARACYDFFNFRKNFFIFSLSSFQLFIFCSRVLSTFCFLALACFQFFTFCSPPAKNFSLFSFSSYESFTFYSPLATISTGAVTYTQP